MVDDESRVSLSGGNLEHLIVQDNIKLLLGPSANSTTARDAAIAEQHQLPMVQSSGPSAAIFNNHYRYVFDVGAPASRQMEGVIDMALNQDLKPQTVAILAANDTLSTELGGGIRDYATSRGLSVVYFGSYPSGTNDVRSQLAGAAGGNPDLLLEAGHPDESVLTMEQARQLNVPARLIAFTQEPTSADFVSPLRKIANYAVGTTQWSPLAKVPSTDFLTGQDYASQYLNRFGHPPDQHSAGATAACLTLAAASHQAGSVDPAKVRDALTRIDLHTFFGEVRFDDQGVNPSKAVYVMQVQAGKPVVVWPPEAAGATPRYPIPAWDKR
jgi:branched-chain amino acid transport system substrate-binding protein